MSGSLVGATTVTSAVCFYIDVAVSLLESNHVYSYQSVVHSCIRVLHCSLVEVSVGAVRAVPVKSMAHPRMLVKCILMILFDETFGVEVEDFVEVIEGTNM